MSSISPEYVLGAGGAVVGSLLIRLLALFIALRGTTPGERPAIIRALGDLFRLFPRRPPRQPPRSR
ncbi:hypothetical protein ACFWY9_00785 [Amycolatopsis sp. NPDC059027]|uniref:hypothetical protein n=1 Tax=unclassified Amycolatopsis TaxID=2618356 RepID=UPI00366B21D6